MLTRIGTQISDAVSAIGSWFSSFGSSAAPTSAPSATLESSVASYPASYSDSCTIAEQPLPPPVRLVPSSACNPQQQLEQLVRLQEASGAWPSSDNVAALLGTTLKRLASAAPSGVDPKLWITLVVVAVLETKHVATKTQWALLVQKARRWAAAQLAAAQLSQSLESLVEAAKQLNL